jgi:hypothetical protein
MMAEPDRGTPALISTPTTMTATLAASIISLVLVIAWL